MIKITYLPLKKLPLIFILFTLFLFTKPKEIPLKIRQTNVLFPICDPNEACLPTYAYVSAQGGCFTWHTKYPYLIDMEEIQKKSDNKGCYSKVSLSPRTSDPTQTTQIIAREKDTDKKFTCKIGFGKVHKISLEKYFNVLKTHDEHIELHVEAYDIKNNKFTTLEGWIFNWEIIEGEEYGKIIKSAAGNKKIGKRREEIEKYDYSDIVQIQGLNPGKVRVRVTLKEPRQYSGLQAEGDISVIELFKIVPNEVFMLMDDTFTFRVKYDVNEKSKDIYIDNNKFEWVIEENEGYGYGNFDSPGGFKSFNRRGDVVIAAKDKRFVSSEQYPKAIIHIVGPNSMQVGYRELSADESILNNNINKDYELFKMHKLFRLVESKRYIIQNFLMFNQQYPIAFNSNRVNRFILEWNQLNGYITDLSCDNNNIICTLIAIKSTEEYKTIKSLYWENEFQLNEEKNVIIYEKIHIEKFGLRRFYLPYLGNEQGQELYLRITGGSKNYILSSDNIEIIEPINNNYYIGRERGIATVKVNDVEFNDIYDTVEVEVIQVNEINYFEERQEVKVNSKFAITPVGIHEVQNKQNQLEEIFTNCTRLSFSMSVNNEERARETERVSHFQILKELKKYTNGIQLDEFLMKYQNKNLKGKYEDYLQYSNYGICGFNQFDALSEGLVLISYTPQSDNSVKPLSPAEVFIYKSVSIQSVIKDEYSKLVIQKGKISDPDNDNIYILSLKDEYKFYLNDGVKPYRNDYYKYINDKKGNKSFLELNFIEDKTFSVICKEEGESSFDVILENKKSKSLLRPGKNRIEIKIGCYYPKHLSIYFLSMRENLNLQMYIIAQPSDIQYYQSQNSTEIVRIYAFDDKNRLILNIQHIKGEWQYEKPIHSSYYEIIPENQYLKRKIKPLDVYPEFMQYYIYFKTYEEQFKMKYSLKLSLPNQIKQTCIISVINFPIITPKTKLMYLRGKNDDLFTIIGGSGQFEVTLNDNTIAYITEENKRTIKLHPKNQGEVKILVTDNFISNYITEANVIIGDIKEIIIQGARPLLVGNKMLLTIEVIDTFLKKLDYEDYKLMSLAIDDTNSFGGLSLSFTNDYKAINVKGLNQGYYSLYVYDKLSSLTSNVVHIRVFKPLEIYPPYLLLLPGASYTLQVKNFDLIDNVAPHFEMEHPEIASVINSTYPLIKGLKIGNTTVKVSLDYLMNENLFYSTEEEKKRLNKMETIFSSEIPIEVALANKIDIQYLIPSRKIFTLSTIRVLAVIKKDMNVFTYGVGPISFEWDVSNRKFAKILYSKAVYSWDAKGGSNQIEPYPESAVGAFLRAMEKGDINVFLKVIIDYPSPYKSYKPRYFTTNQKIEISDEVAIDIPHFYMRSYLQSSLYLLPFNIEHDLLSKGNNTKEYSIINNIVNLNRYYNSNIISLSHNGHIVTFNKTGVAIVQMKDTDIFDNKHSIPISLPIYVTKLYSLFAGKSNQFIELQISQVINVKIVLQHSSGLLFAKRVAKLPLSAVESHPHVAKCKLLESNSLLEIKAYELGTTNIILFNSVTREIYDVFTIKVTNVGQYAKTIILNLGATLEFNSNLHNEINRGIPLEWESENPNIVDIKYNKAHAIGEGETKVFLKNIEGPKMYINIDVRKIAKVGFDNSKLPQSFSDDGKPPSVKQATIPLKIYTLSGREFSLEEDRNLFKIHPNIVYSCTSEKPEVIFAKAKMSEEGPQCFIQAIESKYSNIKPKKIGIELIANVKSQRDKKVAYIVKSLTSIQFMSRFKIRNNIKEVKFSPSKREQTIYIDNIDNINELDINYDRSSLIEVEKNSNDNSLKFKIPNDMTKEFKSVVVNLEHLGNKVKEEIKFSFSSGSESIFFGLISTEGLTDFLTMILLIVIIIVLAISILSK